VDRTGVVGVILRKKFTSEIPLPHHMTCGRRAYGGEQVATESCPVSGGLRAALDLAPQSRRSDRTFCKLACAFAVRLAGRAVGLARAGLPTTIHYSIARACGHGLSLAEIFEKSAFTDEKSGKVLVFHT